MALYMVNTGAGQPLTTISLAFREGSVSRGGTRCGRGTGTPGAAGAHRGLRGPAGAAPAPGCAGSAATGGVPRAAAVKSRDVCTATSRITPATSWSAGQLPGGQTVRAAGSAPRTRRAPLPAVGVARPQGDTVPRQTSSFRFLLWVRASSVAWRTSARPPCEAAPSPRTRRNTTLM